MTDYFSYKKIYTTGGLFTRTGGEDFVGYAQYKDGEVSDFETGEKLTPGNTYDTDVFMSRVFKDRTIDDFNISLPVSESECLFSLNDTLNFKEFKFKLEKIKENNAFVFSRLFIASNLLPRARSISYSALESEDSTELTSYNITAGGAVFGNPIFSSSTQPDLQKLGDVFSVTSQPNYDYPDRFALFCATETALIALTGDSTGASVTETSSEYETISSNVLPFGRIGGITSNSRALFVSDTDNSTVIKYDITGYLNNDAALANTRYITSVAGGSGLVDRRANFNEPTAVACDEDYLAVFARSHSDNFCIKVFTTDLDYYTTLTFINFNKQLQGIETFSAMAFDPDFKDLYIITTTDDNDIILYRANVQNRQIETINLTNTLDDDEVVQSISFSRTDSNYWYFNTNKRVYKKYKTRPTNTGVGFYDEARLGDFRNGVIGSTTGENRWNLQNTNFNLTNFYWNFKPESEQIVASIAGEGIPIEAQKFRGFNVVSGPDGQDKVVIFTKSKIYHFNEPSTTAYQTVLNKPNYTNYGINGFSMSSDEYIQVAVINSEIYKLVYDLLLLKNNLVGRFAGKYENGQFVLNNYNYNIDFSKFKRENVEDYFIHHNEENIVGALNRIFGKIYEVQQFVINSIQVDTGDGVRDVELITVDELLPDLVIEKKIETPGPYTVGSDVVFSVTLSNIGEVPATNIKVSDSLSNINIINDPRGIMSSSITINPGETITAKYSYTLVQPGKITNTVTTTGGIATSSSVTIAVSDPSNLTVSKSIVDEPTSINVGDTLSYKVVVTNTGGSTATNLNLVDSLGFRNITNITGSGADMLLNTSVLSELPAGESVEVNYDYVVQTKDIESRITNIATLTFNPGTITVTETVSDSVTTNTAVLIPTGEQIFTQSGNFVVPDGVTSVSVVLVGSGVGNSVHSTFQGVIAYGSSDRTPGGFANADGGGRGGYGSPVYDPDHWQYGTGGGAGGYTGNGGAGVNVNSNRSSTTGKDGYGGGGAGAGTRGAYQGRGGGGVGLFGQGASGKGRPERAGEGGSGGQTGGEAYARTTYGGAYGGGYSGGARANGKGGGGLAWKNNIAVTPGDSLPVTTGGNGAVRIIWGPNRAFPTTNTGQL